LATALLAGALLTAAAASGAALVVPPDGATVSGTPTLAWGPAPGEDANLLELSPSPATGGDGAFADDPDKRIAILADAQTSYTVPAGAPLFAGTWYWHVQTLDLSAEPGDLWSLTRRLVVADGRIRLVSFELGFLRGIDDVVARFAYSDNSRDLAARYRLEFRKRRHGRRVATRMGTVDRGDLRGGEAFVSVRRPHRLRSGARCYVRLALRDAGGHVTRSRFVRIRL
jgi:hypothetical protein